MDTRTCHRVTLDSVSGADLEALAAWITATRQAPMISALEVPEVRPADIERWLEASVEAWILRLDEDPVALATLSTTEAELPEGAVEACHVIVRPEWRRRFKGTQLVAELTARARDLGFTSLLGRVVPHNGTSHGFLQWLHWRPAPRILTPDDDRFVWYRRMLDV